VNHAPVADQVSVAIRQAKAEGINHITIQLDPADLGRVEVKLHVGNDGQTSVAFTVDKPSTFDTLSRDAHNLERSLQDAGIKADTGSMQFNLRQQPQPQPQSNLSGDGQYRQSANTPPDESDSDGTGAISSVSASTIDQLYRVNIHDGVDIHA
jgi:flagellar hook-length control protein FliK